MSDIVLKFNVSKSAIVFKTALKNLIDDFPKNKRPILVNSLFLKET